MGPIEKRKAKFIDLYGTYYTLIYNVVYSKTGDVEHTRDICQEVFIRLFEKLEEVQDCRKWLYGTMRYVIIEHFRKRKDESIDTESLFEEVSLSFVNGFRESRIIIEQAIEEGDHFKDETDRLVFELVAYYNYSYPEAGNELGLTERMVRYRYRNITKSLIDHFKKMGIKGLEDLL